MRARGFTLVELVVAIMISAIVLVFASMFIGAPLGAYEAHSRRMVLVADASGAWPRLEGDLRNALPNSLRWRRNGSFVVIEMLPVLTVARYVPPLSGPSFTVAGVTAATPTPPYLAINPGADVYALNGSTVPVASMVRAAAATAGEFQLTVDRAPAPIADSPKGRLFFVGPPIAYLCDEVQGTLRRYANYSIAASLSARDSPGELAGPGVSNELITEGLTNCEFSVAPAAGNGLQAASVRLTSARNNDSVTLLHTARGMYAP